jgi:hypothetical protein
VLVAARLVSGSSIENALLHHRLLCPGQEGVLAGRI